MAAGENSEGCSVFGPWMVAVRQRWSIVVPQSNVVPSASASGPVPHPASASPSADAGWKSPVKLRRRLPSGQSMEAQFSAKSASASVAVPIHQVPDESKGPDRGKLPLVKEVGVKGDDEMVAVPVLQVRAVFKEPAKGQLQGIKAGVLDSSKPHSLMLSNPFASLSSDAKEGGHLDHCTLGSGPLKRARPVDSLPPRSISKPEKRKGKGKVKNIKSRVDIIPPLACATQPPCYLKNGQEVVMVNPGGQDDSNCDVSSDGYVGHGSVDIEVDPVALKAGSTQIFVGSSQPVGCHNVNFISGDQGGIPSTSC